jgi:multiple sugar transport system permease protein
MIGGSRQTPPASSQDILQGTLAMADVVVEQGRLARSAGTRKRASLHHALKRKSTVAFLMTLPLILLIALLVLYHAFYSVHLATLN